LGLKLEHDIISNLDEIVERLLSNHAAVMVGAGFSMNALKSSPEVKNFPNWADLGDAFYKKVNGKPYSQGNDRYLNALKLAEEVQAQFGRIVLDKILQQEIPDKKYNPSKLHNKLLQLPWNDVFTTNYDTLLERASQDVISRKYDVIVRNEDLVYSEKPRIIKLHGTFPSQRPFIITEEDYRTYPIIFAPFVNTVQQSLLENALCLIGFSGNDPNFLSWIGWIRDNLGKENSSKIYLIGVFDFSAAQRMLLEKRNIIILDFSECKEISNYNNKHQIALESFLDYLLEAAKKKKEFDWLAGEKEFHVNSLKTADMKEITKVWTETRSTYPGWWILPEDMRKRLWKRTEHTLLWKEANIKQQNHVGYEDLLFLYEHNWRQEKCLIPLRHDQVKVYEEIIEKYNPYPEKIKMEAAYSLNKMDHLWKEVGPKWIEIQLALLRYYRENNDNNKIIQTSVILNQLYDVLSPEQHARYNYEKCLRNLYQIHFDEIKDCLHEWKEDLVMSIWEAKRARIWAILGEVEIANDIIGKALAEVKKQLMLAPVTNNYTTISQEASLMFLSAYYQQAINLKSFKNETVFNDSYKERSAEHKKYKCDPFQEKRIFEIELSNEYIQRAAKSVEHSFDIGHVVNHVYVNYDDSALILGLEFLRYLEEVGIPINVGNVSYSAKIMTNVLQRISYVNPYLTMICTILYGDKNNTKYIFSRRSISEMDQLDVDNMCNALLLQLDLSKNEIRTGNDFGIRLAQILPEILSRLCVKCSQYIKYKIARFICYVYNSGYPGKYDKVNKLMERLIKTCNGGDLLEIIQIFIKIPINCEEEVQDILLDPFIYIEKYYSNRKLNTDIKIDSKTIQDFLCSAEKVGLERKNAIIRLAVLWENGLLRANEETEFQEALWSKSDERTGFPRDTHYANVTVFLELPYPPQFKLEERLKNYLSHTLENIKIENKIVIQEITFALREKCGDTYICNFTREERFRMIGCALNYYQLLRDIMDKEEITKVINISPLEDRQQNIKELIELLMDILLQQGKLVDISEEKKKDLRSFVNELERRKIPCYKLKLSCKNVLGFEDFNYLKQLIAIANSNDLPQLVDCFDAIYFYLLWNKVEKEEGSRLLKLITCQIVTRRKESLYWALHIMSNIVELLSEYIDDDIFYNIICGLEYLYEESQMNKNDADYMAWIRAQAMRLAGRFYYYCKKEGRELPSILEIWKSLSESSKEFWEVRNAWMGEVIDD